MQRPSATHEPRLPAAAPTFSPAPAVPASERVRRRVVACRPTDALEPWETPITSALRALAAEACEAGIALETAVAVVIERALVLDELSLGPAALDSRAAASGVTRPLTSASAAYLRELNGTRAAKAEIGAETVTLSLPARLNDRIGTPQRLTGLIVSTGLTEALRWERAAVGAGLTMTEWALRELLAR